LEEALAFGFRDFLGEHFFELIDLQEQVAVE
jgi:hypothetical protein